MRDYDGKTATERIAERRERLIDAGLVLFGEYGYAGTSIRMVLRQAGLQDRYFTESFDDLDTLLAAVHSRIVEEELALCRDAIDTTAGTANERARAVLKVLMKSLDRDRGRARVKLREVVSAGPAARAQRRSGLDAMAEIVAELLPSGTQRNRRLVAISLVAATYELMIAWLEGERGLTRNGVVDMVMLLFESVGEHMASPSVEPVGSTTTAAKSPTKPAAKTTAAKAHSRTTPGRTTIRSRH